MYTLIDHPTLAHVISDRASLIKQLAQKISISNRSATIVGDPIERYGVTMIPVAKVKWHSAGSNVSDEPERSGAVARATLSPTGYVIIKDGKPRYQPIFNIATILPWLLGSVIIAMLIIEAVRRLRHA